MQPIDLSDYIQLEGPLFEDVQRSAVFNDSKTFVDSTPKIDPPEIMARYHNQRDRDDFNIEQFVRTHFHLPENVTETAISIGATMEAHIEKLWDYLGRTPKEKVHPHSTLIPLRAPYIVPGGRFREIYYWDSYFTAEGLAAAGRIDMVENLVKNFCYLIRQVGHVPNGNRKYYVSRSQPPFLFLLVDLLERHRGRKAIAPYIDPLKMEYRFWMQGSDTLTEAHSAHRRVVRVNRGSGVLNRYWDDRPLPREESWREDVEVAMDQPNPEQVHSDLRAGAESGWDFTSRWLDDYTDLKTIRTTSILPVDLNALLYGLEMKLGKWTNGEDSDQFRQAARKRKKLFNEYFWNEEEGYYFDYDIHSQGQTDCRSLAGVYSLFLELATRQQADRVAGVLEKQFLRAGGLVTSLHETGQQWDAPNGWAPLQWMAVIGLRNYGHEKLAETIARRWVKLNRTVFDRTGKMMEKYNVCDLSLDGGGGEYPLQDGFGWTNGVVTALQNVYNW
ncbi:MAG: alpha,alpha-trehalase TreF [Balneolaceae bacterium]|nr:alpha,alpha-trehalase TreF [Balneolaceae bacterium]